MLLILSVEILRLHNVLRIEEEEDDEDCLGYGTSEDDGTWYIYDDDVWNPLPDNWRMI